MKCPLTIIAFAKGETVVRSGLLDCNKEECAWWIPAFKICAVTEIAIRLGQGADELFNIQDKMPQDERTRERM